MAESTSAVVEAAPLPASADIERASDFVREELVYDGEGTPLTTSFMDYLCPTSREMPEVHIHHLHGETTFVPSGAKGIGEGNSMSAPVTIANAIADALSGRGIDVLELPVHGSRIWKWLQEA